MKKKLISLTLMTLFVFPLSCAKKENQKIDKFYSYPNPFSTVEANAGNVYFRIRVNGDPDFKYKIEVFTENGYPVYVTEGTHSGAGDYNLKWYGKDNRGNTVNNGIYTSVLTIDILDGSGNSAGTYREYCYTVKN